MPTKTPAAYTCGDCGANPNEPCLTVTDDDKILTIAEYHLARIATANKEATA